MQLPSPRVQFSERGIAPSHRRGTNGRELARRTMLIDFNTIDKMTVPGMNGGTGTMTCRMFNDERYRIIPTRIHPGGSIGEHVQESGDDLNYVLSGTGVAVCDGKKERLGPGVMHICPQGSSHSIANTGEDDLVLLTIVVKR